MIDYTFGVRDDGIVEGKMQDPERGQVHWEMNKEELDTFIEELQEASNTIEENNL